jgi:hypothetical protein
VATTARTDDLRQLHRSISRVVMRRFEQCGVGPGGSLTASTLWRERKFDEHFLALRDAFILADRYRRIGRRSTSST